jgi:hypothetical protein
VAASSCPANRISMATVAILSAGQLEAISSIANANSWCAARSWDGRWLLNQNDGFAIDENASGKGSIYSTQGWMHDRVEP